MRKKTRHDKPNEILISGKRVLYRKLFSSVLHLDDWTPDYWHPINEHILESLAKNADEEAKINAERAEAGYAARFDFFYTKNYPKTFHFFSFFLFRNLADLAKKELEARKNGKAAGRIVHDENEKLKHEK